MTTKDTLTLLREVEAAIKGAINSDMAMREEDEGETSSELDALRNTLPAIQELIRRASVAPVASVDFARLCKNGMPIPELIGMAQSVEFITDGRITEAWRDSLLQRAEAAKAAWDDILNMFGEIAQPPQAKGAGDE